MKKVELLNLKGEKEKDINLNEEIFGIIHIYHRNNGIYLLFRKQVHS